MSCDTIGSLYLKRILLAGIREESRARTQDTTVHQPTLTGAIDNEIRKVAGFEEPAVIRTQSRRMKDTTDIASSWLS